VSADLVERQFLATADFTREIYDEGCLFQDEIDTYTLPKFIKGTSALFVKEKSAVRLVGAVTVCAMPMDTPCVWVCDAYAMHVPCICHAYAVHVPCMRRTVFEQGFSLKKHPSKGPQS
jgi:hypothetical protein